MCKGKLTTFFCPVGWRQRSTDCPYFVIINSRASVKPYMGIFAPTSFECCGNHTGDCNECLELYTVPGNLKCVIAELVECDFCTERSARARAAGAEPRPTFEEGQDYLMPAAMANNLLALIMDRVRVSFHEIVETHQERDLEIQQIAKAIEERMNNGPTPLAPPEDEWLFLIDSEFNLN